MNSQKQNTAICQDNKPMDGDGNFILGHHFFVKTPNIQAIMMPSEVLKVMA
jgi:hypothetical protein